MVNSCIREVDRIEMRVSRKLCVVRLQTVSKFRRAVSMKIMVEDSKICNIVVECKRWKTVSKRRRVNKTESF